MSAQRRGWLAFVLAVAVVVGYVASVGQVDLAVFLRAGHDVLAGRDPYPPLSSPLLRENAAYVYPVAVAYVFAPLAAVPASVVVFDLLTGAALLGALRLLGVRDPAVLALAILTTPALIGLQDGTLNALLLLAVAAAWRWRERPVVAGLLVTAAVVAKVFLWPLLLWLLLARRYRALGVAVPAGGVVGGVGFLAGPLSLSGYQRLLSLLGRIEAPHARSVAGLVLTLGGSFRLATVVAFVVAAIVVVAAGLVFRRHPGGLTLCFTCGLGALLRPAAGPAAAARPVDPHDAAGGGGVLGRLHTRRRRASGGSRRPRRRRRRRCADPGQMAAGWDPGSAQPSLARAAGRGGSGGRSRRTRRGQGDCGRSRAAGRREPRTGLARPV